MTKTGYTHTFALTTNISQTAVALTTVGIADHLSTGWTMSFA